MEHFDFADSFFIRLLFIGGRYFILCSAFYFVFWKLINKFLSHRKIQKTYPSKAKILNEIKYSLSTIVIFSLFAGVLFRLKALGYTQMYDDVEMYGWVYLVGSVVLALIIHDTYFYFTHRLMHHPLLFKHFHSVHHHSTDPTPFAAFSFHPLEAFVQASVMFVITFVMPMHFYSFVAFTSLSFWMNVEGHLSYELYSPKFTRSFFTRGYNTITHHNMHHKYFNCNYSLYFNFWDRILKTNHDEYHDRYDELTEKPLFIKKVAKKMEPLSDAGLVVGKES